MKNTRLILIDGYAAAGKSTCLQILSELLGQNFHYVVKYSTRQPRLNEIEQEIFSENCFLSQGEFEERNLDFIYLKGGAYYGLSKQDIESQLENKCAFVLANEYFRGKILSGYSDKFEIIQLFVDASSENRLKRIHAARNGEAQMQQRLERFHANKERSMQDFDMIIDNNHSLEDFRRALEKSIPEIDSCGELLANASKLKDEHKL